jgi:dTDP-L-rhamnose 4-epimerase
LKEDFVSALDQKTVLVTGGAGFIGSALSQQLAKRAKRWVVMDSMHPQVHPSASRPVGLHTKAELVVGDVVDPKAWDSLFAQVKPDVVVHLAAETGTAQSLDEASRHSLVNVVGTTQMLDAFGRHSITPEHVLLSSSRAVYGEGSWKKDDGRVFYPGMRSHDQLASSHWDFPGAASLPSSAEVTETRPTSVYGATKLAQENILKAWAGARLVDVTILRLQNVYGPGQSLINSYTGIVSLFSQWAEVGKAIPVYEDGEITRDFVFIDDIASAFVAAINDEARPSLRTLDIGSGHGASILEIAGIVADYHQAPKPSITGAFRDGDVRHASCSIAETVKQLDWEPRVKLREGVARLQKWIKEQDERVG